MNAFPFNSIRPTYRLRLPAQVRSDPKRPCHLRKQQLTPQRRSLLAELVWLWMHGQAR